MREERLKVLEMLAAGKVNVEEASALLDVLQGNSPTGKNHTKREPWGAFPHFDFASFFEKSFGKSFSSAFGKGSFWQR